MKIKNKERICNKSLKKIFMGFQYRLHLTITRYPGPGQNDAILFFIQYPTDWSCPCFYQDRLSTPITSTNASAFCMNLKSLHVTTLFHEACFVINSLVKIPVTKLGLLWCFISSFWWLLSRQQILIYIYIYIIIIINLFFNSWKFFTWS